MDRIHQSVLRMAALLIVTSGPSGVAEERVLLPEVNDRVLAPLEALEFMRVEKGFEVELVAAEPEVVNPVVVKFDSAGRMWVVEMRGFMPDVDGTDELRPVGRISIHEDTDGDGRCDKSSVFLDGLREPRAMAFHKDGILWADYLQLYFTERLAGDVAGETIVVDPDYTGGNGNVEHKPNGLLRALDNWYYNAKSRHRYREVNGKWIKQETAFRGQWGISQDDAGRLYHGTQSQWCSSELFAPDYLTRNTTINLRATGQVKTGGSSKVFPVRRNWDLRSGDGRDRGHVNANKFAIRPTAACWPHYYRGGHFPEQFQDCVYVAEPGIHLIKAIRITRDQVGSPSGKHVFDDRELVASSDIRFRPVCVTTAPDGSLVFADMYHGIIQHAGFMSDHLRKITAEYKLDSPDDLGRVYRIRWTGSESKGAIPMPSEASPEELVKMLGNSNGWVRDTAQRLLVDRGDPSVVPNLMKVIEGDNSKAKVHAIWVIEGLGKLSHKHVMAALEGGPESRAQAARVSWELQESQELEDAILSAIPDEFDQSSYHLLQRLAAFQTDRARDLVADWVKREWRRPLFIEGIMNGIEPKSSEKLFSRFDPGDGKVYEKLVAGYEAALNARNLELARERLGGRPFPKPDLPKAELAKFERGEKLYGGTCFACHGLDGEGMPNLGPPLAKSEWVTGSADRLAKIVLHGMEGEIEVRGEKYQPPAPMPGFGAALSDEQIAEILTYVRNAWENDAGVVSAGQIESIRKKTSGREGAYSARELN